MDQQPQRKTLREIVQTEDLPRLEAYCLSRTGRQVREQAKAEGIDLDTLEELLYSIS